jgi:hypothetical protein
VKTKKEKREIKSERVRANCLERGREEREEKRSKSGT